MKDIRPAMRLILLADATVSGLVGGTRIFPTTMPQGEVNPSVVYHRITEGADYVMAGGDGLLTTRLQVDAWAQKADQAAELAGAVFDRLSGFRGDQNGVTVQGAFMVSAREDFDSVAKMYRMSRDYEVWYS
jgi:hypothetical protein